MSLGITKHKDADREQLKKDVEEFLKNGGTVQKVDPFTYRGGTTTTKHMEDKPNKYSARVYDLPY